MGVPTTSIIVVSRAPLAAAVLMVLAVGGCATFSKDGGFDPVSQQTRTALDKDVLRSKRGRNESLDDPALPHRLL